MSVALIDYQSGNLHSARKAFERIAAEVGAGAVTVTESPDVVAAADRIVLPGDGAFPACARALRAIDGMEEALQEAVHARGRPFLGICVGMQLLATTGYEYEETPGLGWIDGTIRRIEPGAEGLKVPHMGWNDLVLEQEHPLLEGLSTGYHAYFVHSYAMQVDSPADRLAHVGYGADITAIVARGNVAGTQFHPEKSQAQGLRLIANFLRWAP
ncbi:imidazole glycerol phosphate synthase subunit HisH [Pseudoroseicyclus tamaricis]|uniref:Imidazole glycerol phosphate synthase subunit HisH n=1 Tax=Pseudoroseicyclus tamaricis TaxID=2705421 RepID=A0A6B2JXS5_9RHOB|nr:imidazole glycerol phosphate synthase subunit HisH [Pseudoroseicyclus tamaricis]NDV00162.1 imidazole glycerol phosphate synthase subunit HisH [Pseudoroseicyclus tamaricis]